MNYILFDGTVRNQLLPFTYTRPVADIRIGILTIREKWERFLGYTTSTVTEEYLSDKWPMVEFPENVMINASYLPTPNLVTIIKGMTEGQGIFDGEEVIAFYTKEDQEVDFDTYDIIEYTFEDLFKIEHTWDIFSKNARAIAEDYALLTEERTSQPIPQMVVTLNAADIFIEEGAKLPLCSLNAENGPIYIGKDAEIMEGSMIRGPFALCEHATVKMGAKIYGGTTVGPHLKNNYASVKLWDYETGRFANTGLQFCGLMIGDHSKCGINTMFNTGTVIGVATNIFGSGFPRNFVPSFQWGGANGFVTHLPKKAYETARIAMARRDIELTEQDEAILNHVFEETKQYRRE